MMRWTVFALLLAAVQADIYLHNMRGSNNRLDEARRDRNNANRLFDSQNNNRGGNNVGNLYFYEGTKISLAWTNQHGCASGINNCELIIQYMCHDLLRDGATTRTIPEQPSNCLDYNCNTDVRYGMHEDYDYYMNCKYRFRNKGLFTADRRLQGETARFTRQNNNGQRRGYECPEERDYYPYWHPTPWIDVAILTSDASRCDFYKNNSENVLGRHYCKIPDAWYHHMIEEGGRGNQGFIPNTQETCEALNSNQAMTNFLKAIVLEEHADRATEVQTELETCLKAISDCEQLGDSNAAGRTKCFENFNATSVTLQELNTAVPSCSGEWVEHPSSECRACIPAECANSFIPANMTASGPVCDSGYQPDAINSAWCILNSCANRTNTVEDRKAVDVSRKSYLAPSSEFPLGRFLVDWTTPDICVPRPIWSEDCYASTIPQASWVLHPPHNAAKPFIQEPACHPAPWTRENHLGNTMGGFEPAYNWSMVPDFNDACVMRIRYNISTHDYNGLDSHNASQVNSTLNRASRNANPNAAKLEVRETHNIPMSDSTRPWVNARGYYFQQNPDVQIFDFYQLRQYCDEELLSVEGDPTRCYTNEEQTETEASESVFCPITHPNLRRKTGGGNPPVECVNAAGDAVEALDDDDDFDLQLAINTNQFGRTFQDRTHRFKISERPVDLRSCDVIHALNVKGKRGNIVQTYPGTEYDFHPNRLHVAEGDCIHFQWTGSNTNPNNNDGQGKQGTDRSNVALQETIRGEGGRGVEGPGGKGRDGTTWTTAMSEMGLEGYVPGASPTMFDYPCPDGMKPHPLNWSKCVSEVCDWLPRTSTTTVNAEGESVTTWAPCPTGYKVDTESSEFCVITSCATPVERTMNNDLWSEEETTFFSQIGVTDALKRGAWGVSHPEHLDKVVEKGFLGLTREEMIHLATLDNVQLGGEMSELDDAGTYFDLPPHKVTGIGTYHYLCTRNNNFSNRGQKGKIVVSAGAEDAKEIDSSGGVVALNSDQQFSGQVWNEERIVDNADASLVIPKGSLNRNLAVGLKMLSIDEAPGTDNGALWVGPENLAAIPTFPTTQLEFDGETRRRSYDGEVSAYFFINSTDQAIYRVSSSGLAELARQKWIAGEEDPFLSVEFRTESDVLATVTHTLTGQTIIQGTWGSITTEQMEIIQNGEMWMTVTIDGSRFNGQMSPMNGTGEYPWIKMTVPSTITDGSVYFYPQNRSDCITAIDPPSSCQLVRKKMDANFEKGSVTFTIGAGAQNPSGGFYVVSGSGNVPVIVGVSILCVLIALALVGSAVYFRHHPDKWEAFRGYGPAKYTALKRSLQTQV